MSRIADAFGVLMVVVLVTTLVLPKRQTPAVITSGGTALSNIIKASLGQA